jgi:transposase, IS6 family
MSRRPLLFKWRQFEPEIIVCAVRWYLRYSLSYREVQELLAERGITVDHSTVWRWVQRYAPEIELRQRAYLKPTNRSWRVDETYLRVKGEWCYLYRAVDSQGATVDFFLSAFRDRESAQILFRRALRHGAAHPRVINTDLAPTYPTAIAGLKRSGVLRRRCKHRPVQYLNNIIEQDHRAIKRRVNAKQGFRAFAAARRTVDGYEAMHRIRKGQVRWVPARDVVLQNRFIDRLLGLIR